MRAVIYARYSSENQREASIEDQVRECRAFIDRQGWAYQHAYTDRALSGASTLRAGYQLLLQEAREGRFDVVVAEALDRLSRDQEDIAALYKRLRFAGIGLVTLGRGRDHRPPRRAQRDDERAVPQGSRRQDPPRAAGPGRGRALSGGGNSYGYDVVHEPGPTACRCVACAASIQARPRSCGGSSRLTPRGARRAGSPTT